MLLGFGRVFFFNGEGAKIERSPERMSAMQDQTVFQVVKSENPVGIYVF